MRVLVVQNSVRFRSDLKKRDGLRKLYKCLEEIYASRDRKSEGVFSASDKKS